MSYSPEYYARIGEGSRASAATVVPLVLKLVQPASVVDVGCGTGAWLAEFRRHGINNVLGIDGAHVAQAQLEIESTEFLAADLTQPLPIRGQFDLALSLEVAEHLPENSSQQFIQALTRLAPVVLFSAAVPHQGGEHHVNEQWPAYWVERFSGCGFVALDPFRPLLWQQADVEWWYAQNLLLFVREEELPKQPRLQRASEQSGGAREVLPLVHPRNYKRLAWHNRVLETAIDLTAAVPAGCQLLLADADAFNDLSLPQRTVTPFLERGSRYAGPPTDDADAIAELRRMQAAGANYIAFGWPAFWWLTHYRALAAHLEQHHQCLLRNERVVLYALRDPRGELPGEMC